MAISIVRFVSFCKDTKNILKTPSRRAVHTMARGKNIVGLVLNGDQPECIVDA